MEIMKKEINLGIWEGLIFESEEKEEDGLPLEAFLSLFQDNLIPN